MNELSPRARALIDTVGDADGPTKQDRARIRRALFGAVAGGLTLSGTAATALGAPAAVSSAGAAGAAAEAKLALGAALAAFGGKNVTTAQVALWLLAGSVAGVAVAAPVVWYADRSETPTQRLADENSTPPAFSHRSPSSTARTPSVDQGQTELPARLAAGANEADVVPPNNAGLRSAKPVLPVPSEAIEAPRTAVPQSLAGEVDLLQRAQRELSAGKASVSLSLLDDHARRFPQGALKVERLAARVFALCELGQVGQARAAAGEFFSLAAESPLVPRVQTSCAGRGDTKPR